jgi:hypothetical protein
MPRICALVLMLLVALLTDGRLFAGKKPPPKNDPHHKPPPPPRGHPHAKEIADLTRQIVHLRQEEANHLARIQAAFHQEVRKLDGGKESLESQIARLRHEESAALRKVFDLPRMRAIEAKYDAQVAELQKLVRAREARMANLARKKRAETAAVWAAYRARVAKLDDPDGRLETKLARLWDQQRVELLRLVDRTQYRVVGGKFVSNVTVVERQVANLPLQMTAVQEAEDKSVTAVRSDYEARIAKLDPPADAPEGELQDVKASQQADLDEAADAQARETAKTAYADQIAEIAERKKSRDEQVALLKEEMEQKFADVHTQFQGKFEALNGSVLLDQLVDLRVQQRDAIVEVVDGEKGQVILANYGPQITRLQERIHAKNAEVSRLWADARAAAAKINSTYGADLARLDRREDRGEYKIARLRAEERLRLAKLAGLAKVRAIESQYEPHIRELLKRLAVKQRHVAGLAQRTRGEMVKVAHSYEARIAHLEQRRVQMLHSR